MSHDEHHGHHITPVKTLVLVFAALVFFTVLTVVLAQFHFGALEVPIALGIALIKATLVVMIFMALKWDNRVNATVLAVGVLFVLVFISFTLMDTEFRGDLSNTTEMTIMDAERAAQAPADGAAPATATH